jgi:hypothetical protein
MSRGNNDEEGIRFLQSQPQLHAKQLKRQVTIRLDHGTIAYFRTPSRRRHQVSDADQSVSQRLRGDSQETCRDVAGRPSHGRGLTRASNCLSEELSLRLRDVFPDALHVRNIGAGGATETNHVA